MITNGPVCIQWTCVYVRGSNIGEGEDLEEFSWSKDGQVPRTYGVYYVSIHRESNKRFTFECRCDGRLKSKDEGSPRLAYTRCLEEP